MEFDWNRSFISKTGFSLSLVVLYFYFSSLHSDVPCYVSSILRLLCSFVTKASGFWDFSPWAGPSAFQTFSVCPSPPPPPNLICLIIKRFALCWGTNWYQNLEDVSQTQKDKCCIILLIYGIHTKVQLVEADNRMVVARGWGVGETGRCWSNATNFQF